MGSWKQSHPRQLKKIAYAINEHNLNKLIVSHEERGWSKGSEIKDYGYGVGCLMIFKNRGRSWNDGAKAES